MYFSYIVLRDDRIGFIGPNGCGKSTLMKMIMGILKPDEGNITIGDTVKIGYFAQENEDMTGDIRVIDYIRNVAEYIQTTKGQASASQMLDRFLFPPELQYTPLDKLSGGEQRRLYLLKVLMEAPNVLILDEPTNHLDITSKEILERALNDYTGTILYVSHDRYFINQTATRILELTGNTFVNYIGNYDYYLEKKDLLTPAVSTAASEDAPAQVSESKLSWQEQKEEQARLRKRQNDLKKTEERIGVLETRNGKIDELMMQEEVYTNSVKCQELAKEKTANEAELEELYEKWEELAE